MDHEVKTSTLVVSNGNFKEYREDAIKIRENVAFEITEPKVDDEITGDKEAEIANVLARYKKTLIEKTTHHLGIILSGTI